MKWTPGSRGNIEDRRGRSGGTIGAAGGIGVGGLLLLFALSWATGVDFTSLAGGGSPPPAAGTSASPGPLATTPEEENLVDMVDAVVEDGQSAWRKLLGNRYQNTRVVIFRDATSSGCGHAQSATGPFYCPADRQIYLDVGFFEDLHRKLGAPGHFAQAYVVAHELGHHVQTVLGVESDIRRRQAASPASRNPLSVRLELQADCFAGVWGYHARSGTGRVQLESGDIEQGLDAAAAIGDDRLQRMQGGRVAPDRFTHGTSQQRAEWFRRGLKTGDPSACDTFQ